MSRDWLLENGSSLTLWILLWASIGHGMNIFTQPFRTLAVSIIVVAFRAHARIWNRS